MPRETLSDLLPVYYTVICCLALKTSICVLKVSISQESGNNELNGLVRVSHKAVIEVLARAGQSQNLVPGKNVLPEVSLTVVYRPLRSTSELQALSSGCLLMC